MPVLVVFRTLLARYPYQLETGQDDPSIRDLTLLSSFGNEHLYRMEWISEVDVILQMLTNSHATIMDAYGTDGRWYLRVLYPDRDALTKTTEFVDEEGFTFEVNAIRQMEGKPTGRYGLTESQFEALSTALIDGYYEVPRGIDQSDLADKLGISHQALSERLRRATRALLEDALRVGAVQAKRGDS